MQNEGAINKPLEEMGLLELDLAISIIMKHRHLLKKMLKATRCIATL